jgi:hypothetical protein
MFPCTVMVPPSWQSWRRAGPAGEAVGPETPDATGVGLHGPAHPAPVVTFHSPLPRGVISTAGADADPTVTPEDDVTITEFPLFSVMTTLTQWPSWAGLSVASEVPP